MPHNIIQCDIKFMWPAINLSKTIGDKSIKEVSIILVVRGIE